MRTLILPLLVLLACCAREPDAMDAALTRGMEWIVHQESAPDAGTLHACLEIARLVDAPALKTWVTRMAGMSADPFTALVTGTDPAWAVSAEVRGHARMQQHLLAAIVAFRSADAALELERFLAEDLHGYMLTHQLYAVHWARERGWKATPAGEARIIVLLDRLLREADTLTAFSDLRAEQLQLSVAFGRSVQTAEVERLLRVQDSHGAFVDATEWDLAYDGESVVMRSHPLHTTAQALLLLARVKARRGA